MKTSLESLNSQFPTLEITELVGRGGMGAIYKARQTRLERDVALKIIAQEIAGESSFVERFEREAKTLARLSHPHIVTIYDFGQTADGQVFLIMEYVDGINLREAMNAGSMGADDALEIAIKICEALEYAHGRGVVHRDIKPENILLGEDGTLKVADFGIAKIVDDSIRTPTLTATRQVLGSVHYLAPEHLENPKEVDHRVDLYAVGVILYELLTGQLPLGRYEPPSAVSPNLDHRLDEIVMKTLSRQPKQRFQRAAELSQALHSISGTPLDIQQAETARESSHHKPHAHPPLQRPASVPFTCDTMGGFAEAVGMVHAKTDRLVIEHSVRDSVFGTIKSQTHVVDLPFSKLTRVDLVNGIFSSRLVIVAETISALGKLPNAETGRVELKIKRHDTQMATRLVQAINAGHPVERDSAEAPRSPQQAVSAEATGHEHSHSKARWTTLSLLLVCCGIINAGLLFVVEYVFRRQLQDIALIAASVSCGVVIGPVAIVQLWAGVLGFFTRLRHLALAVSVVSMLPVTPAWVISFPMGIWATRWLRREGPATINAHHPSWGATTLMFIRESRWGKLLAATNALGFLAVVAGLFVYRLGLYPAAIEYRIVARDAGRAAVASAISARLGDLADLSWQSSADSDRLLVETLKSRHSAIEQLLAIEGTVSVAWLEPQGDAAAAEDSGLNDDLLKTERHETASDIRELDVAPGLELPTAEFTRSSELGRMAQIRGTLIQIQSDFFSELVSVAPSELSTGRLAMQLTQAGKSAIITLQQSSLADRVEVAKNSDDTTPKALGLISDRVLIGIALDDRISGRSIEFQLASESALTAEAIVAAARGPIIPSQLERIK